MNAPDQERAPGSMTEANAAEAAGAGAGPGVIDMGAAQSLAAAVHAELGPLVHRLAETQQTYGLAVMVVAVQLIVLELRALDRAGAGAYLRAMADLMDPPLVKLRKNGRGAFLTDAEHRRRDAVQALFDALKIALGPDAGAAPGEETAK